MRSVRVVPGWMQFTVIPNLPHLYGQGFGQMDQRYVPGAAAEITSVPGVATADVDDPAPGLFLQVRDGRPSTAQSADIFGVEIAEQLILI